MPNDDEEKISVVARELDKNGVFKTYMSYIPTFVLGRTVDFFATFIDHWILAYLLGSTALSMTSQVLPLHQWTHFAFTLFNGIQIYLSHSFGENDKNKVNSLFTLSFYLTLALATITTVLYINSYTILSWFSDASKNSYLVRLGYRYLLGVSWGLFPMIALSSLGYLVRIDGSKYLPLFADSAVIICNICLDFALIGKFRYFGAGIATSISYWIGLLILSTHFLKRTNTYRLLATFNFSNVSFKQIVSLTCPRLTYQAAQLCNVAFLTYLGFHSFGVLFHTINCIYNVAWRFTYIATVGTVEASQPLIGIAYGQKDYKMLYKILHSMYVVVLFFVGVLCLSLFIFPQCVPLLMNLHPYDEAFGPTCTAIRLLTISAAIYALNFIYCMYYQLIGHENFISVINLLQSTLFLIPFYYLLFHLKNATGFWWSNIIKELIVLVIQFSFHLWQSKKLQKYL